MRVLVLAGTQEARQVAQALAASGCEVIASFAGETWRPADLSVATRTGGFGGEEGLAKYIQNNEISAIVDATHPFSTVMSWRVMHLCHQFQMPLCQLRRPAWTPQPDDTWWHLPDDTRASMVLPADARVFLATGRKSLAAFQHLECDLTLWVVDPPEGDFPAPRGRYVVGRPPFTLAEERELFRDLGITHLVAKNAGGPTEAKLQAARDLGIQVVMIQRPAKPNTFRVETAQEAVEWALSL